MTGPLETRTLFEGKTLALREERWPEGSYEIVARTDAVVVVAVDGDAVVLVRQFRPAAGGDVLELPAGKVDAGEAPEEAARRELAEETGYGGGRWEAGPVLWATPGYSEERMHFFFADELESGDARPQGGESIDVVRWSADEVVRRLNEMTDGKTLTGLLLFLRRRGADAWS